MIIVASKFRRWRRCCCCCCMRVDAQGEGRAAVARTVPRSPSCVVSLSACMAGGAPRRAGTGRGGGCGRGDGWMRRGGENEWTESARARGTAGQRGFTVVGGWPRRAGRRRPAVDGWQRVEWSALAALVASIDRQSAGACASPRMLRAARDAFGASRQSEIAAARRNDQSGFVDENENNSIKVIVKIKKKESLLCECD